MPQPHRATNEPMHEPWVEIIEQPSSKSTRFRYESENAQGGILVGASSSKSNSTFPTIKVHNHKGACVVVVSLVTTDEKPRPHPHALVGTDCKQEVCTKKVKTNLDSIVFNGMGIQCKKKNQIEKALTLRKQIRVDPFRTGFEHMQKPKINDIDLSQVRLCFQVFLPDKTGKYQRPLAPVTSDVIQDKKGVTELTISDFVPPACSVEGGESMILLTGKLPKDDFEVMFYEGSFDQPVWKAFAEFQPKDIHQSVAVKVKIPRYTNTNNPRERKKCHIVLRRKSNRSEISEKRTFMYYKQELLNGDRPRKRASDGVVSDNAKRSRYDQDASEEDDDALPATVQAENFTSAGSNFTSGESSFGSYSAQQQQQHPYQPQVEHNSYYSPEGTAPPGTAPTYQNAGTSGVITGQDQWIPVRASDLQFIKNEFGHYTVKPGPTALNQAAAERDLSEFNLDPSLMEKLINDVRTNPDSEVFIPSNMSDILNSINLPSDNPMVTTNEVLVHSSGESSSLTREIRDISAQVHISYNQAS